MRALRYAGLVPSRRSTSRSIITVAIGNLAAPLAAFVAAPILAHGLGVEGRGEVAAGTALLLLATAVGTLGVSEAATYFVAARIARPNVVLRRGVLFLLVSGVVLTGVSYLIAPALAAQDPELTAVIRIAGFAITPTLMLGAFRGVAQGSQRWELINLEKYLTALLRVVPLVVLLITGALTPLAAVLTLAGAPIAGGLAYLGLIKTSHARMPTSDTPPAMIRYGLRVWVGSLSGVILSRLDQTLMTPLSSVYELGLYVVAVNLADLLLIGQSALGQVLFAVDARGRDDQRLYLAARLSTMASLVLAVGLGLPAVLWIRILFGAEFEPAAISLWLLLLSHTVGSAGSIAGVATSARGRPGLRSSAIAAAAVLNVGLVIVLVPAWGAAGAAFATLCGSMLGTALNIYFARRHLGMSARAFCIPRAGDVGALVRILRSNRAGQST